jgi:hypothetical protein
MPDSEAELDKVCNLFFYEESYLTGTIVTFGALNSLVDTMIPVSLAKYTSS